MWNMVKKFFKKETLNFLNFQKIIKRRHCLCVGIDSNNEKQISLWQCDQCKKNELPKK